ncbi:MAG: LacI family transcriptional regulator [Lentisphaerae bacterium]|nr:LacI family transcriptional regulator [Lentisphaerota bacterium]
MSISLKELAFRAGLSQSTVSQILNRRPNDFSSESTRRRVFALAKKLGYRQSFGHKVLRGDKTHTVAILLGMHRLSLEEHIQELLLLLLDKFESCGYASYLVTLSSVADDNLARVRDLLSRGVDYFILIGSPYGESEVEAEVLRCEKRIVGYNTNLGHNLTHNIAEASRRVLSFFLEQGCSNFKILLSSANSERMQGLFQLFPDRSPEELIEKHFVQLGDFGDIDDIDFFAQVGYEKTKQIMLADRKTQALFYLSDYFALGGVKYLHENGYKIGRDILLAGYNNIHAVRNHILPISSVRHNTEEMARIIVEGASKTNSQTTPVQAKVVLRKL